MGGSVEGVKRAQRSAIQHSRATARSFIITARERGSERGTASWRTTGGLDVARLTERASPVVVVVVVVVDLLVFSLPLLRRACARDSLHHNSCQWTRQETSFYSFMHTAAQIVPVKRALGSSRDERTMLCLCCRRRRRRRRLAQAWSSSNTPSGEQRRRHRSARARFEKTLRGRVLASAKKRESNKD